MLVVGPAAVTFHPPSPAASASRASSRDHDRTAVIEDRPAQIDRWIVFHQMRVDRIASREHPPGDKDDVADFE